MMHELKIQTKYFKAIKELKKRFELRKNDRNYQIGDYVKLSEWDNPTSNYSGQSILVRITYVLDYIDGQLYGLQTNYCIFGFELIEVLPTTM